MQNMVLKDAIALRKRRRWLHRSLDCDILLVCKPQANDVQHHGWYVVQDAEKEKKYRLNSMHETVFRLGHLNGAPARPFSSR